MNISQLWTVDTAYAQQDAPIDNGLEGWQLLNNLPSNSPSYEWQSSTSTPSAAWSATDNTVKASCTTMYGSFFTPSSTIGLGSTDDCACTVKNKLVQCSTIPSEILSQQCTIIKASTRSTKDGKCTCLHGLTTDGTACLANNYGDIGLKCSAQDILNNTCTWNINKTLGIKASNPIPNPELFVQDIVLGATSFVGTGVFIALVVMWFKAVAQGWSGSEDQMGKIKSWIINLLIGVALIMLSYTIIRIVQYVARGY